MSAFKPTLPVHASPARPAMTPMSVQNPTAAALAAAAAASAPAWSAARSSPHVSEHLPASMAVASHTPLVGSHGSHVEAMQEDSDAGTEDGDTAPLRHGMHAEWLALVEYAKSTLPVAFRSDGPQLAFVFDEPPSPNGADGNDPDGPAKRKRVMVDGYEMEEDGEDGMNVSSYHRKCMPLDCVAVGCSAVDGQLQVICACFLPCSRMHAPCLINWRSMTTLLESTARSCSTLNSRQRAESIVCIQPALHVTAVQEASLGSESDTASS